MLLFFHCTTLNSLKEHDASSQESKDLGRDDASGDGSWRKDVLLDAAHADLRPFRKGVGGDAPVGIVAGVPRDLDVPVASATDD